MGSSLNHQIKLSEFVYLKKGKKQTETEKQENNFRYIQIDDLRNDNNLKYTSDEKIVLVHENDILIAWDGANAGTVGYGLKGAIGSTICAIKINEDFQNKIYPAYLGLFLKSKNSYLREKCEGATIPHLQRDILLNLKLNLVDFTTQHHIATTLDHATELIEKRKTQIAELDKLVKAVFLEMFGDPVVNSKNWKLEKLKDLGLLGRGMSKHRPRDDPKLLGGDYPLIQTGDVANSNLYIKNYNSTYSEFGLAQSKMWKKGTLCITIAANIAKTGILDFDSCFPDSIVGFIPNKKTNVLFIHFWFGFFQQILEENAPESAQKNINLKILSDLDVINPPLGLQTLFAEKVCKIQAEKDRLQRSLVEMEQYLQSLMAKFFG